MSERSRAKSNKEQDPDDPFPRRIDPMRAKLGHEYPTDSEKWLAEFEWRGLPVIAYMHQDRGVKIITKRESRDIADNFPAFSQNLESLAAEHNLIIEGELVFNSGRTEHDQELVRFQASRKASEFRAIKTHPYKLVAYDLLYLDGEKLLERQAQERKKLLSKVFPKSARRRYQVFPNLYEKHFDPIMISIAQAEKFPAVIIRRKDAPYQPGKSNTNLQRLRPKS